jgi:hypothetical protein
MINIVFDRFQQSLSNNDKKSTVIVDDNVSSCDNDESGSEEQKETTLSFVVVKSISRESSEFHDCRSIACLILESKGRADTNTNNQTDDESPTQLKAIESKCQRRSRIPERPNHR